MRRLLALAAALAAAGPPAAPAARLGPSNLVIVANRNVPASVELAAFYAERRGVPTNRVVLLDLPDAEQLARGLYELRLRDPLLAALRERKLIRQSRRAGEIPPYETEWITVGSDVAGLVCLYGVPLHIAETRSRLLARAAEHLQGQIERDGAAVDSELALLLSPPFDIRGRAGNPMYNRILDPSQVDRPGSVLVATRLDGPSPAVVRRMIEDSLFAETNGLAGRGYFDGRGRVDPGYEYGEHGIVEAAMRFQREGFECALDTKPGVLPTAYPMEDAALYFGWYLEDVAGPFLRSDFRFVRGAVAYHLHSFNARTLRSETRNWAGPLLARGAACTLGAVDEPFLILMPDLEVLADRLCHGYTFGESALMALPALSWQITVIGDPLYRPFTRSRNDIVWRAASDASLAGEWDVLRLVNSMVQEGRALPAIQFCRQEAERRRSLVLRERLADLLRLNGLTGEAGPEYEKTLNATTTAETAIRCGLKLMDLLRGLDRARDAETVRDELRRRFGSHPCAAMLEAPP